MNSPSFPNKRDVRRAFDAAASTYDANAFLQREIADRLFERLDYIKVDATRILEVGCGTGYATKKLREKYLESELIALDLAPAMVRHTADVLKLPAGFFNLFKKKNPPHLFSADAEYLPLASTSIDFAISNLTIQWCDPQQIAREVARVLRPNGLFMFTTFGPDTLMELRTAFQTVDDKPHVNQFVDMHDIGDMLVEAGFADPVMDQEIITLTYSDLKTMLRELKGIGAHNVLPGRLTGLMGRTRWQRMVDGYERFRVDGRLPATYEVVYGHAWMPTVSKRKTIDGQQKITLSEFKRMVHGDVNE